MGINPTQANFKSFTFDGKNSRGYGVYITGQGVFNAPERNVEMIEIPNRNGAYALDKGNFKNIEVTYPAGIFADTEADFAQAVSDFRNLLCSKVGYVRLEDDYNPNEYRLAIYKSGLEVDHGLLIAGEFDLVFECKPQRYLKSGEDPITIGEWGETTTYTGAIAQFENPNGYLAVKSLTADIEPLQDLHGYDKPWVGGAGVNLLNSDYAIKFTLSKTITFPQTILSGTKVYIHSDGFSYTTPPSSGNKYPYYVFRGANNENQGQVWGLQDSSVTLSGDAVAIELWSNGYDYGASSGVEVTISGLTISKTEQTTYSPYENICPITGWTGCEVSQAGVNLIKVSADSYDNSQACTSSITDSGVTVTATGNYARRMDAFNVVVGQTYTLSFKGKSTGNNNAVYFCKSAGAWNDRYGLQILTATETEYTYTFTATTSVFAIGFYVTSNSSSGEMTITDLQLELGSTASDYKPYQGTTYPVSWQDDAGTVYGGTVDVVSGVLTVDRASVDLGTLHYNYSSSDVRFYTTGLTGIKPNTSASVAFSGLSDIYETVPYSQVSGSQPNDGVIGLFSSGSTNYLAIKDTRYTNTSYFRTALSGHQLVYELATPTTYQLDPVQVACLLGQNNVWNNVGDTSIEVGNDPKYVINPTRFDAQPFLEVEGYGNISFNGYNIELFDDLVGTVYAEQNANHYLPYTNYIGDIYVNANDGISLHAVYIGFSISRASDDFTISTAVDSNLQYGGVLQAPLISIVNNGEKLDFAIAFDDVDFSALTAGEAWASVTLAVTDSNGISFTNNYRASVKYDGVGSIAYSITGINIPNQYYISAMPFVTYSYLKIVSTATTYGHPTLIDCETGEVYTIKNGIAMSLGRYVALGSELPTLASGANTITYDNTITSLKLTPRWWQV